MLHANRISKVNEPLYYYILKREGAITATFSENILQMYDSLAIMNEYYIREGAFEEFKEVLGFINLKHTILRFRDFTAYLKSSIRAFSIWITILMTGAETRCFLTFSSPKNG